MSEANYFWIQQYENQRWEHTAWALMFALVAIGALSIWVFTGDFFFFFVFTFEYVCFLGHIYFALAANIALEAEWGRL